MAGGTTATQAADWSRRIARACGHSTTPKVEPANLLMLDAGLQDVLHHHIGLGTPADEWPAVLNPVIDAWAAHAGVSCFQIVDIGPVTKLIGLGPRHSEGFIR